MQNVKRQVPATPFLVDNGNASSRERHMYPKEKIYAGAIEISIEELLFLRWKSANPDKASTIEKEASLRRLERTAKR